MASGNELCRELSPNYVMFKVSIGVGNWMESGECGPMDSGMG